jgi:alcohol dehydrogenase YqhD (iron-dependent ADH family)
MEHVLDENIERFKQLAVRVFGVQDSGSTDKEVALEGIRRLREFWSSLGAPTRLADYDIDDTNIEKMAEHVMSRGPVGNFKSLSYDDVVSILKASL